MNDDEFVEEAEMQIWLSAFAASNPKAPCHKKAEEFYSEAQRRGKPWLYQRAWNKAYRSCGYMPTAEEIAAARPQS